MVVGVELFLYSASVFPHVRVAVNPFREEEYCCWCKPHLQYAGFYPVTEITPLAPPLPYQKYLNFPPTGPMYFIYCRLYHLSPPPATTSVFGYYLSYFY
jgi:hypothetical protein